jgi:ABC-2 type transport system ATP-binding protein
MDTPIEAKSLTKTFGSHDVVDHVNLKVEAGEIYGLVGPDGAGKTTTMRLLCGALQPTTGEVLIGGHSMRLTPERCRGQIGYLPQRFSLYDDLTVLENIRFFAEVRGLKSQEWKPRSLDIIEFVGLGEFTDRWAGRLSGGMRQKLTLAAALVHNPKILLLDEPTTGVDPVTRQDFWQLIIRLSKEEGVAVVVTTPYMDEAARCGRVGFIHQGRMIVEGSPADLCAPLDGKIVLLKGSPLSRLREIAKSDPSIEDALMFGDRIHLRMKSRPSLWGLRKVKRSFSGAEVRIDELRPTTPQLEDVFIALLEAQESQEAR